jgi:hypothetical protein
MSFDEKMRAWYDCRDCGLLSKTHPLQAAISVTNVLTTKRSSDILEDNMVNFCRNLPNEKLKLSIKCGSDVNVTSTKPRDCANPPRCASASLSKSIELADDLYSSNEVLSRSLATVHNEDISKLNAAVQLNVELQAKCAYLQTQLLHSQQTASADAQQTQKLDQNQTQNKFRSAKDQFTSEVCVMNVVAFLLFF